RQATHALTVAPGPRSGCGCVVSVGLTSTACAACPDSRVRVGPSWSSRPPAAVLSRQEPSPIVTVVRPTGHVRDGTGDVMRSRRIGPVRTAFGTGVVTALVLLASAPTAVAGISVGEIANSPGSVTASPHCDTGTFAVTSTAVPPRYEIPGDGV